MKRGLWCRPGILGLLVLFGAGRAAAAGYSLYEQGARALGAGGAFTARCDDASSVFFNPAGLARVRGGDLYAGVSMLLVSRSFAGEAPYPGYEVTEQSPDQTFFPVAAYAAHQLGSFAVGFGFYSPFGLTTEWKDPDSFSGRFISTKAVLKPFYFNPAVAWNPSDRVRVGAGLMAVTATVQLDRAVGQPNPTEVGPGVLDLGTVSLDASNDGLDYGFNAGAQVDLSDRVAAGINYRSRIDVGFTGDADFEFTGGTPLDPQIAPLFPPDQTAKTEIPLPGLLVAGVAWQGERSALELDFGWQNWADFQTLSVRFEDPSLDIERQEEWNNAWFLRGGWEYGFRPDLDVRLGAYYDRSPQPASSMSPLLPDNDRVGVSAGLGFRKGAVRGDLYGLILLVGDRDTGGASIDGFDGTYGNNGLLGGLSLGLGF